MQLKLSPANDDFSSAGFSPERPTDPHRCDVAVKIVNAYLQHLKDNGLASGDLPRFGVREYVALMQGPGCDTFAALRHFLQDNGIIDYDAAPDYEEPNSKDTILAVARYIPRREASEMAALRAKSGLDIPEGMVFLFDMDGVLLFTPHEKCWGQVFDPIVAAHGQQLFTAADYFKWVSGKNRFQGIRDFFAARGITEIFDTPAKTAGPAEVAEAMAIQDPYQLPIRYPRILEIAEAKNILVRGCLKNEPIQRCEPTIALMEQAYNAGIPVAVVSASKSTWLALNNSGIAHLADLAFDGRIASIMNLPGKPDPAPFANGALALGADPRNAVVFEDADKGVVSGKAAKARYIVGLAVPEIVTQLQAADIDLRDALSGAGADIVVSCMSELPLEQIIAAYMGKGLRLA